MRLRHVKTLIAPFLALFFAGHISFSLAQEAVKPGPYLAGRYAEKENDFRAAGAWYERALIADKENPYLIESSLLALIASGGFGMAADKAAYLVEANIESQSAVLMHFAALAQAQEFDAILVLLDQGVTSNPLMDQLFKAWAQMGKGDSGLAMQSFEVLAKSPKLAPIGMYHKALALAYAGDFESAEAMISNSVAGQVELGRNSVVAYVQILSQLNRNSDALALLDRNFPQHRDPLMDVLRLQLHTGEAMPFVLVANPTQGMGEAFFTLAYALNNEAEDQITLLYGRLATYLNPNNTQAHLMVAHLLDNLGQYDLAYEAYRAISADDPASYQAELGRANALDAQGNVEAALEVLRSLVLRHPDLTMVHLTLADMLRRQKYFEKAISAYDAAEKTLISGAPQNWVLYYGRGISHEQSSQWDKAEADFNHALVLVPDQPQVLNYLGYSYIDRNENLTEALAMIERAVHKQPDNGYIVDSLAWGLYRLGRYQDALPHMERAALSEPVDPIVTDHLGDIYWAVGRKLEAQFQWRRALSFNPTESDADRIRSKLELGLDGVLAEEGAPALHVIANGQ